MRLPALLLFSGLVIGAPLSSQCPAHWLPGAGFQGTDGAIHAAVRWDPDGAGPLPEVVVLGGEFRAAGDLRADRIVALDPVTGTFGPVGLAATGADAPVRALAVLGNGDLVAAGSFAQIGGVAANRVAVLRSGVWQPLGAGVLGGDVLALLELPGGDLVVGGSFTAAGGVSRLGLARWNGTSWQSFGGLSIGGVARALLLESTGAVVVGGSFSLVDTIPAQNLARWRFGSWSQIGGGLASLLPIPAEVQSIAATANGQLVVGGRFDVGGTTTIGPLAAWTGTAWVDLGLDQSGFATILDIEILPTRDIGICGLGQSVGGVALRGFALRSAATGVWTAIGGGLMGNSTGNAVVRLANGELVVVGFFTAVGTTDAQNLARWDGSLAHAYGSPGIRGRISAIAELPNGDVVVGGGFDQIAGAPFRGIARWDGTSWHDLAGGVGNAAVYDLLVLPNGDLVAAGSFQSIGGQAIRAIARWDGTAWSQFGAGLHQVAYPGEPIVTDVEPGPNGELLVVGRFSDQTGEIHGTARWDGVSWSQIGTWTLNDVPNAVLPWGNGHVLVAGRDAQALPVVAEWNGTAWTQFGAGFGGFGTGSVKHLGIDASGALLAGGTFRQLYGAPANYLARWNGTAWQPVGSGPDFAVYDSIVLPSGDLVVAGGSTGTSPNSLQFVARWNGSFWSAVDGGVKASDIAAPLVEALTWTRAGLLYAGGYFSAAGAQVSGALARLASDCPATAVAAGAGCTGSGGPNVLAAATLPWIGTTWIGIAQGMPANGLALDVGGLSPVTTPLASILPQGQPGCDLLVSPVLLQLVVPSSGVVQTPVPIPNAILLIGATFHRQVVAIDVGPNGIAALTATNRLTLTIGSF